MTLGAGLGLDLTQPGMATSVTEALVDRYRGDAHLSFLSTIIINLESSHSGCMARVV